MKKFVLCLTAVLFAAGTAHAEYVRKRIRPNFFIPARELERAEKLPRPRQFSTRFDAFSRAQPSASARLASFICFQRRVSRCSSIST